MEDIVIIGAGVAGLTLAHRLKSRGIDARVLEARGQVGGRVQSLQDNGSHYELGATWVWESERDILGLVKELGITVFQSHRGGEDLYESLQGVIRVQLPGSPVPEYRIDGGPSAIARALAESLQVELRKAVRSIVYDTDSVVLEFDDETLRAKKVVVALPPALLGTSITIEGPPGDQIRALAHVPVWMGDMAKDDAVQRATELAELLK